MDQEQVQKPGYWAVLPAAVRYDPQLPPSAKILYAEISALTDQRGFCFASNDYFCKLYGMGERTVRRLIAQLQELGYIRIQDGDGGAGRRKIYAGINPLAEEPGQKWPGYPDKNGRVHNNSIENNTPPTCPPGGERAKTPKKEPSWKPKRFSGFWNFYPKSAHKSKQAAIKAWDQLRPSDELIDEIAKALRRQMATDQWKRGIGIPYPSTYLRQRRWEDEIDDSSGPETPEEGPEWI